MRNPTTLLGSLPPRQLTSSSFPTSLMVGLSRWVSHSPPPRHPPLSPSSMWQPERFMQNRSQTLTSFCINLKPHSFLGPQTHRNHFYPTLLSSAALPPPRSSSGYASFSLSLVFLSESWLCLVPVLEKLLPTPFLVVVLVFIIDPF